MNNYYYFDISRSSNDVGPTIALNIQGHVQMCSCGHTHAHWEVVGTNDDRLRNACTYNSAAELMAAVMKKVEDL